MAQPKSTTSGQRPALRLVSTKRMNREDWLKIRKRASVPVMPLRR